MRLNTHGIISRAIRTGRLVLLLTVALLPASEPDALSGAFSGGNLGSIGISIDPRPTLSGGRDAYTGSSSTTTYRERDWSPSTRSSSSGPDLAEAFKPIADALNAALKAVETAVKPITDVIEAVRAELHRRRVAEQVKRETIARMRSLVAEKRRQETAQQWAGIAAMSEGEIEWWFKSDFRDPGDCEEDERQRLQRAVEAACKKPAPVDASGKGSRACKASDSCDELLLKMTDRVACAAARYLIMRTCYPSRRGEGEHGDKDHDRKYVEERNGIANCIALLLDPKRACLQETREKAALLVKKLKLRSP